MSTKWCHQCGSEFIARVEVCPDCGVELGTEPPGSSATTDRVVPGADGRPDLVLEPGDQLVYELHEWSEEARHHLEQLLRSGWPAGRSGNNALLTIHDRAEDRVGPYLTGRTTTPVVHVWQGTDLVVPLAEQERAEAYIDQVEISFVLALDPDAPKLAYDLSDLADEQLDQISDSLAEEGIPHGFDDETGELVVHEADEEKVEAILDAVDFPDALPVDDDEGDTDDVDPLAAQEAMSDLFVAADRLRKDAHDPDGVLSLVAAAAVAATLPVPYGFSEGDWSAIVDRAGGLASLIEADDTDDSTIEEAADGLRTLLRQYV